MENGRAKLTEAQVIEIRQRRAKGETLVALGKAFGVSHVMISDICTLKSWRHI